MYYIESGKVDLPRTIICALVGIALLIGLSWIYNILNNFIPIIYANVIITVGYGLAIGMLVRACTYFGRVRNKMVVIGGAVLFGLIANYTQWMDFVTYLFNELQNDFSLYLSLLFGGLSPIELFEAIGEINQYGTWGLGFSGDNTVNGFPLTIVWIIEFAIILGIPVLQAFGQKVYPFSEEHNQYFDRYLLKQRFRALHSVNPILESLTTDPATFLEGLGEGTAYLYSIVEVYYLPNSQYSYLDISKITVQTGESSKEKTTLMVDNLKIETAKAKQILERFENKKDQVGFYARLFGFKKDW